MKKIKKLIIEHTHTHNFRKKLFLIIMIFPYILSCNMEEKLTAAECERIQDQQTCLDRGCVYQQGSIVVSECGGECSFCEGGNSELFTGCFLSDTKIQQQLPQVYHRQVGDQYEIVVLASWIGNLEGWEFEVPDCVQCSGTNDGCGASQVTVEQVED